MQILAIVISRFKEIYRKGPSINDIVLKIKAMQKKYNIPDIEYVITDHEHNGSTILRDAGFSVKLADKTVSMKDGVDLVRHALTNSMIKFNSNSLDEPCPELGNGINCLSDEFPAFTYKDEDKLRGNRTDDNPDPSCKDHALDDLRYYCVDTMTKTELLSMWM